MTKKSQEFSTPTFYSKTPDDSGKAMVLGGLGQPLGPLRNFAETVEGSGLYKSVTPLTITEWTNPRYRKNLQEAFTNGDTALPHSLGAVALRRFSIKRAIGLALAEATTVPKLFSGLSELSQYDDGLRDEDIIPELDKDEANKETYSPRALLTASKLVALPFGISISGVEELTKGRESGKKFTQGAASLEAAEDEYGFKASEEQKRRAEAAGVEIVTVDDFRHNDFIHFPDKTSRIIAEVVERMNSK